MNRIDEYCSWCNERLTHFQNSDYENQLIYCPTCGNQYRVEYDDYYYSYLLRKCVNGKKVSEMRIKK